MSTNDIAIVGYAHTAVAQTTRSETQLLFPVVRDALAMAGLDRDEVGFVCAGSCDYLTGGPFAFVFNLEAAGAWPPICESHVEMDGAWALYEAWIRLLHGDIDTALVMGSGKSSSSRPEEVWTIQGDPYFSAPLGLDAYSLAGLQARALLESGRATERDLAEVAVRAGRAADVDTALAADYLRAPLRHHDLAPFSDGAAAVVLARGERARQLSPNPVWISGIDHRVEAHLPGFRDLATSVSSTLAARKAGYDGGPLDVAELCATSTAQELILRAALGIPDSASVNSSGGPLITNPVMATGLIRFIEAAARIRDGSARRAIAHAAGGQALQQNLVAMLEAR
ncbi:acetyl-CoA acetyltransferase [Jatrophihabitans sp. GAS493]|uniref:lipid-transfer protein n=1 Tax=Jatrophihabitans sp. GAS493 TaxID=1907575 RepID=UPI000BB960F7|nr:lipid-transfer protein [Jatrophihabitans sp. GAS493]SOD74059.1 acetyl-CoA acetyltransferase [Jatrophihabitans sp. GAS493]